MERTGVANVPLDILVQDAKNLTRAMHLYNLKNLRYVKLREDISDIMVQNGHVHVIRDISEMHVIWSMLSALLAYQTVTVTVSLNGTVI